MANNKLNSQQIEILGRNFLVSLLIADGLEVALPVRDRGVDLIAYSDIPKDGSKFRAVPIQLKAFRKAGFNLDIKYSKFPNLLMAYVWNSTEPSKSELYLMTYGQAVDLAAQLSPYFSKHGKYARTSDSSNLNMVLKPYKYQQDMFANIVSAL